MSAVEWMRALRRPAAPPLDPSVMDGYQPEVETPEARSLRLDPPLEAPMLSPDDLLGPGMLKGAATAGKVLAGPALLAAKMALSRGGKAVPRRFAQSGALIQGDPRKINQELTAIHKTWPSGLRQALTEGDEYAEGLFAPSYAITKGDTLGRKFGNITMVLRGTQVDPSKRAGVLANRDNYTATIPEELFEPATDKNIYELARGRAEALRELQKQGGVVPIEHRGPLDKLYPIIADEVRRTQRGGNRIPLSEGSSPRSLAQTLAITKSPDFRTHKEFVDSPYGAQLLREAGPVPWEDKLVEQNVTEKANAFATLLKHHTGIDLAGSPQAKSNTISAIARGEWSDKVRQSVPPEMLNAFEGSAQNLLKTARTAPSQYAEGKVLDWLPINQQTVQAVITPPESGWNFSNQQIIRELERRKIPIANPYSYEDYFGKMGPQGPEQDRFMNKILQRINERGIEE